MSPGHDIRTSGPARTGTPADRRRPSRSAGHLELAEVGTELGEDARTREADLIPEEDGPRLLASQAGLDLVGPAVVEVVEHGGPELGEGFVDVV